ncbi:AAA family ATPase [Mesohalobacter halotolerans]|uniref:AAA family ATPase n=1 Tax=Mesohalobacter halotolerans TaxID=1883405 RepID=UPI0021CF2F40|nr:AAA family ATPase [Mesohalobacter halotolerans]
MIDEIADLKIIITASSALDINKNTGEPLTGRKFTFNLFPFSENEFNQTENAFSKDEKVKQRLVFGSYPELIHINNQEDKKDYLNELISSYLLKDILAYENIESSQKIFNLLRLIAFQIGGEVSYQELGKKWV